MSSISAIPGFTVEFGLSAWTNATGLLFLSERFRKLGVLFAWLPIIRNLEKCQIYISALAAKYCATNATQDLVRTFHLYAQQSIVFATCAVLAQDVALYPRLYTPIIGLGLRAQWFGLRFGSWGSALQQEVLVTPPSELHRISVSFALLLLEKAFCGPSPKTSAKYFSTLRAFGVLLMFQHAWPNPEKRPTISEGFPAQLTPQL